MVNTKVTLCGLEMDNPVIPASGTFGYGYEFAQLYDINCLGTFSFKGTTAQPRFGNPTPRIAEFDGGMLNAVGLQNPGVDAVIAHELPLLKQCFHKPVMANVSGFSIEEYVYTAARLDAEPQVGWIWGTQERSGQSWERWRRPRPSPGGRQIVPRTTRGQVRQEMSPVYTCFSFPQPRCFLPSPRLSFLILRTVCL